MRWLAQKRRSLLPAALALLGILYYAALLPNHLVSELDHLMSGTAYGGADGIICRSGKVPAFDPAGGSSGKGCPFCKGLAAFQLALAGTPQILPQRSYRGETLRALRCARIARTVVSIPRNRGPPSLT